MNIEIVRQVLASDIISWLFAAIGGAFAYLVLHRMQNTRERHVMIKDIEDSMSSLMDTESAMNRLNDAESLHKVNLRTILHDFTPWIEYDSNNVQITEGQRFILIRDDEKYHELIGTALIHEVLLWFRRVNKLYNDRIIMDEDLADLWRQILPFMRANKLEFYRSYLGKDDTYPILAVSIHCINACYKYKRVTAIEYINAMLKEDTDISGYLTEVSKRWFLKVLILKKKLSLT